MKDTWFKKYKSDFLVERVSPNFKEFYEKVGKLIMNKEKRGKGIRGISYFLNYLILGRLDITGFKKS